MSLRLSVEHRTLYTYSRPIRASKNEARMTPAETAGQRVVSSALSVDPAPTHRSAHRDYFGTVVEAFEVTQQHDRLDVVQTAEVETFSQPHPVGPMGVSEAVADERAAEFCVRSPMVVWDDDTARLAESLRAGDEIQTTRSVLAWMADSLTYDRGATVVGTSVPDVLAQRRGVCQDYAHVCCALLRSAGTPARYVSGYFAPKELEPGESVDAESHAWVEILVPGWGWWAVDPTNQLPVGERHVKAGHGRDYSDAVPLQGVHIGAATQTLDVSVTIRRLA